MKPLSIPFLLTARVPVRSRKCLLHLVPGLVKEVLVLAACVHLHGAALVETAPRDLMSVAPSYGASCVRCQEMQDSGGWLVTCPLT